MTDTTHHAESIGLKDEGSHGPNCSSEENDGVKLVVQNEEGNSAIPSMANEASTQPSTTEHACVFEDMRDWLREPDHRSTVKFAACFKPGTTIEQIRTLEGVIIDEFIAGYKFELGPSAIITIHDDPWSWLDRFSSTEKGAIFTFLSPLDRVFMITD